MVEISFTFPTPEGSQEIALDGDRLSFGRGSEADLRFNDDGLSRLHATVYSESGRVWIVDENSSNGTFVNGSPVRPGGTPLNNGDSIKIGHQTVLKVRIAEKKAASPAARQAAAGPSPASPRPAMNAMMLVPVALIACTILIVSVSAVFIGFKVFGSNRTDVTSRTDDLYDDIEDIPTDDPKPSPTPKIDDKPVKTSEGSDAILPDSPPSGPSTPTVNLPAGKKYLDLADNEKRQYLSDRAMRIAQVIGNRSGGTIPPAALDKIKAFTDAYAKRLNVKPLGGCRFGDNLQVTYERASKNAPFIVRAFNEKGTDPRIGLYLAMIESEHCVCLQSPTGPLGMFQFTYSTAKMHFTPSEGVIKGASPSNPDDRCKPEPSARAAASYMKALTGRYGTGPSSVPLAIGSYNSGEGGLSSNLAKALDSNSGLPRDFWTLIANGEMLSKQFQSENFKYVPKFFAAAIIGENPGDFGLNLQPLSTYSQ